MDEEISDVTPHLSLYSNPAREEIELTTGKNSGEVIVNLYETRGNLVYSETHQARNWIKKQKLDIHNLA